jgi:hypothetical protein
MQIGESSGGMLRLGNLVGNLQWALRMQKKRDVPTGASGGMVLFARPGSTCRRPSVWIMAATSPPVGGTVSSTANRVALSGTWLVAEVVTKVLRCSRY